jgi:hypothetical protein
MTSSFERFVVVRAMHNNGLTHTSELATYVKAKVSGMRTALQSVATLSAASASRQRSAAYLAGCNFHHALSNHFDARGVHDDAALVHLLLRRIRALADVADELDNVATLSLHACDGLFRTVDARRVAVADLYRHMAASRADLLAATAKATEARAAYEHGSLGGLRATAEAIGSLERAFSAAVARRYDAEAALQAVVASLNAELRDFAELLAAALEQLEHIERKRAAVVDRTLRALFDGDDAFVDGELAAAEPFELAVQRHLASAGNSFMTDVERAIFASTEPFSAEIVVDSGGDKSAVREIAASLHATLAGDDDDDRGAAAAAATSSSSASSSMRSSRVSQHGAAGGEWPLRASGLLNALPTHLLLAILGQLTQAELMCCVAPLNRELHQFVLKSEKLWAVVLRDKIIREEETFLSNPDMQRPVNNWFVETESARLLKQEKASVFSAFLETHSIAANQEAFFLLLQEHGGLPNSLRAEVWPVLLQSRQVRARNDKLYLQLAASDMPAMKEREIRQDVTRTFPDVPVFSQSKGKEALFRVLKAQSIFDPQCGYCVPEDHEILTSRGFLDLDAYQAAVAADPTLLVASYNVAAKTLVFEKPNKLVQFADETRELVELSNADEMQNACDSHVSMLVTKEHDVFAQLGNAFVDENGTTTVTPDSSYAKHQAGDLLKSEFNVVGQLAVAEAGVQGETVPDFCDELGLCTPEQRALFYEIYGFWLGDGSLRWHGQEFAVTFVEEAWLEESLTALEVPFIKSDASQTGQATISIQSDAWNRVFAAEYQHMYERAERSQDRCGRRRAHHRGRRRGPCVRHCVDCQGLVHAARGHRQVVRVLGVAPGRGVAAPRAGRTVPRRRRRDQEPLHLDVVGALPRRDPARVPDGGLHGALPLRGRLELGGELCRARRLALERERVQAEPLQGARRDPHAPAHRPRVVLHHAVGLHLGAPRRQGRARRRDRGEPAADHWQLPRSELCRCRAADVSRRRGRLLDAVGADGGREICGARSDAARLSGARAAPVRAREAHGRAPAQGARALVRALDHGADVCRQLVPDAVWGLAAADLGRRQRLRHVSHQGLSRHPPHGARAAQNDRRRVRLSQGRL